MEDRLPMDDLWIEVSYFLVRGGAGLTRMWLSELPDWVHRAYVSDNPVLVRNIEVIRK